MAQSARRQVCLVKLETTPGVDAAPTTADLLLARSLDVSPVEVDFKERTVIRPFSGNFDKIGGAVMFRLTAVVDLAGFGAAGPATPTPGYDALFQIAGMARTVTTGTDVAYNPVTDTATHKSATIYFYYDGVVHKAVGCRANVKASFERGELNGWTFEIMGIARGTTDAALPVPTAAQIAAYQPPQIFRIGQATFPALLGKAAGICVESFSVDLGNVLQYFDRVDCSEQVLIVDRKTTGSLTAEATTVAQLDTPGKVLAGTTENLQLNVGTVAGNMVRIIAPRVQPTDLSYGEDNTLRMQTVNLDFKPNAGNDDIVFRVL